MLKYPILVEPLWKAVCMFLRKLRLELLYDLVILLLGIYLLKFENIYP